MTTVQREFQKAYARHQAGDRSGAEAAYRRLLHRSPRHAEALYLLGALYLQTEQPLLAVPYLTRAAAEDPSQARYFNNLGVALKQAGRMEEAFAANDRALALQPESPETFNNRGVLYRDLEQWEEALTWFRRAIAADPGYAEAHNNLGVTLQAWIFANLEVDEFNYEDYRNLDQAEAHFREAIRLQPDFAAAHNNLGAVLRLQRRYAEAILSVERALTLQPDSEEAQSNCGLLLYLLGYYEQAEAQLRRVLQRYPDAQGALCGLADCARMQGRYREALTYFDQFLAENPDDVEAQYARGQVLLQIGEMEAGWEGYEWRLRRSTSPQRVYTQPQWDGSPLNGRTLLVHAEQGFGDTFQFVRYLPLIPKHGGKVLFECQPGTRELLQRCQGFDQIIERPLTNRTQADVPHDVQIPLMSLARLFPHPAEEPPAPEPYIHADPERVALWRDRLAEAEAITPGHRPTHLKVGLVWAGNPKHGNDHNRSAALADLAPLARVPGVTLYSLQKGPAEEQIKEAPAEMTLIDLAPTMETFSDTAAVLMNLDLLIAVDTSTAHLAGALGCPVWLLTPFAPEWRWMHDRDDSPWYPSVRLFRQPQQKDWATIVTQAASELERLVFTPHQPQIETAEQLFAAGEFSQAKAVLSLLAKAPAAPPRVFNDLGVLYWQEGNAAEALTAFQRALEIAPHDPITRRNCAEVLRAFGHNDAAERMAA